MAFKAPRVARPMLTEPLTGLGETQSVTVWGRGACIIWTFKLFGLHYDEKPSINVKYISALSGMCLPGVLGRDPMALTSQSTVNKIPVHGVARGWMPGSQPASLKGTCCQGILGLWCITLSAYIPGFLHPCDEECKDYQVTLILFLHFLQLLVGLWTITLSFLYSTLSEFF